MGFSLQCEAQGKDYGYPHNTSLAVADQYEALCDKHANTVVPNLFLFHTLKKLYMLPNRLQRSEVKTSLQLLFAISAEQICLIFCILATCNAL